MPRTIIIDTTSVELWHHLLSLEINGVGASRVVFLSENSKLRVIVSLASAVAINMFSSALYDAIKQFQPQSTTLNGRQVPTNQIEIGILINSQMEISQSNSGAECKEGHSNDSHAP